MPAIEFFLILDIFYRAWAAWLSGDVSQDLLDLLFIVTAVIFNLQIIGVYLSARRGRTDITRRFGIVTLLLAFPFLVVFAGYIVLRQDSWILLGLGVVFLYLFLELLLDFILQIDFRTRPLIHIPYIVLFYGVEVGLIATAFSIDRIAGWLVSITFWLLLAALFYSLWPIRNGRQFKF